MVRLCKQYIYKYVHSTNNFDNNDKYYGYLIKQNILPNNYYKHVHAMSITLIIFRMSEFAINQGYKSYFRID